jgi:hypothetical protein
MKGLAKMLKNIFLGLSVLLLFCMITSCKKSCGVNCLHAGVCNGNTCNCPDPYSGNNCDTFCTLGLEGYMCQTLSRERFLGTWSCKTADQLGNTQTYLITFSTNPYNLFMNLNNFNNNGGYPIVCTLTGKYVFSIDPSQQNAQATAAGVSGSGVLTNGKLTIYLTTNTNNYFSTATKQ